MIMAIILSLSHEGGIIFARSFEDIKPEDLPPRDRFYWRVYKPVFIFLYKRKISPFWPLLFLLAFPVFYPIILKRKRKESLKWDDYYFVAIFIIFFAVTFISQIAILSGIFEEDTTQKREGVVSTEELERPWSSHTDRGAYYFREKGR